ncbi:hypothetical protein PsYK624_172930 [Phanerochaete sordida]|uniref:Uncharacterized protein n=1 Tax=Phanerochaete sordida TaxID=48140 RepID=A0A9P3GTE3_9APHY|nr:hypothetical protein PsYK624_172930 [Phanerochaete sordida]
MTRMSRLRDSVRLGRLHTARRSPEGCPVGVPLPPTTVADRRDLGETEGVRTVESQRLRLSLLSGSPSTSLPALVRRARAEGIFSPSA